MKNRYFSRVQFLLSVFVVLCLFPFSSCKDDSYYARPDWLEPPLYDILSADGNFSLYLQAVERTSYAKVLKGAGLYTVFAPNDQAFSTYLSENGYGTVADVPYEEIDKIVAYSIVNTTVPFDSVGLNGNFKYKTQYYALPYRDVEYDNQWVVDQTGPGSWSTGSNNYKYLPAFTAAFFSSYTTPLTASDYNTFYPDAVYTGKNIQSGEVLRSDMRAENGILHEVSTVNLPLDNIDEILHRPEYSVYKALLDSKDKYGKYLFRTYTDISSSPTNLKHLQQLMPNETMNTVYVKYVSGMLFPPALENVYDNSAGAYMPEQTGYTLFVPSNDALNSYLSSRVLRYCSSVEELSEESILALIDAHMSATLVWPGNYAQASNGNGDYLNGEGRLGKTFEQSAVSKNILASNGFVYHTEDAIRSRIFETVYSEILLNPQRNWTNIAYKNHFASSLREDLMKCVLNGAPTARWSLLVFPDQLLEEDGFSYTETSNTFQHSTLGDNTSATTTRLTHLLRAHVFEGLKTSEIDSEISDFSATGISQYGEWNYIVNYYGEPVRYKQNQIQAVGNIDDGTVVTLTKLDDTYLNGTVWQADGMLQYTPRTTVADDGAFKENTLWYYLNKARTENPQVKLFVDYIEKCLKAATDADDLTGIKAEQFYTVLCPNTAAMQLAINSGVLPPMDSLDIGVEYLAQATRFVNSHILQGRVFVDDNKKGFLYPANEMEPNRALIPVLAKVTNEALGLTNQSLLVEISKNTSGLLNFVPQSVKQGNTTLITGGTSGTVRVQRGKVTGYDSYRSNRIACKAIIHEINNYFTFTEAASSNN